MQNETLGATQSFAEDTKPLAESRFDGTESTGKIKKERFDICVLFFGISEAGPSLHSVCL